jgi:DNA modification methylase
MWITASPRRGGRPPEDRIDTIDRIVNQGGVALDPFSGTGTTNLVAFRLGRKSIGIEIAGDYLATAGERCRLLL